MNKILVTGATGQIGSELTMELRRKYGGDNVIATGHRRKPGETLLGSGPFEYIDTGNKKNLEKVIKKYDINEIYHLAAILSSIGEKNPQFAWHVNMNGLSNTLEIAREYNMNRVFWPSSIAVFGPNAPRVNTPQDTVLTPTTIYGVSKVAGELLCNYYFLRFGLDVRSARYPGIIGNATIPGGGTTNYAVEIFYEAIKKKQYTCFLREDTVLPMMYMPDCIKSIMKIMETNPSQIRNYVSYNVTAMSFSAGELTAEIRKHIPKFKCEYKPDARQKIANSWPMSIDDSPARKEWGWKPNYDLPFMAKDMIEKLINKLSIRS